MSPADLLARLVGLAVTLAGVALAWVGLFAPLAVVDGARGLDLLARGDVTNVALAVAFLGIGFLVAGIAVLADRGRFVAVSVGSIVVAAVVVTLVLGARVGIGTAGLGGRALGAGGSGVGVFAALGVGIVALALVFAGARIGRAAA